jgi:hypothetical protein
VVDKIRLFVFQSLKSENWGIDDAVAADVSVVFPDCTLVERYKSDNKLVLESETPILINNCEKLQITRFITVISTSNVILKPVEKEDDTEVGPAFVARNFEERKRLLKDERFIRFNLVTRAGSVYPFTLPFLGFKKYYALVDTNRMYSHIYSEVGAGFSYNAANSNLRNAHALDFNFSGLVTSDQTAFFYKPFEGFDTLKIRLEINYSLLKMRAIELQNDPSYEPIPGLDTASSIDPFVPVVSVSSDGHYLSLTSLYLVITYNLAKGSEVGG